MTMIPFNKPYVSGKESAYIAEALKSAHLSGNGAFTRRCQQFFEERYGFRKTLLTTSGTDALEMCAMLTGVGPGDEVIVPSYTFVSTALAFVRQGASIVFVDSSKENPNIDPAAIERAITPRTKVIACVHYAGVACDMTAIMAIAEKHGLLVVEDAAQAVDSYYLTDGAQGSARPTAVSSVGVDPRATRIALGSIGHLAAFSFHETKNITAGGEGGLLVVNDERFVSRAEILWEKGTNRSQFFRGEINKYGWVDTGSSFLPPEIVAAFLWAQLEELDKIQSRRKEIFARYYAAFENCEAVKRGFVTLPVIPDYATNNGHVFYMLMPSLAVRSAFIERMKVDGIGCVFHYLALHRSDYYRGVMKAAIPDLTECDRYADCLVRLPLFYELSDSAIDFIAERTLFHFDELLKGK